MGYVNGGIEEFLGRGEADIAREGPGDAGGILLAGEVDTARFKLGEEGICWVQVP